MDHHTPLLCVNRLQTNSRQPTGEHHASLFATRSIRNGQRSTLHCEKHGVWTAGNAHGPRLAYALQGMGLHKSGLPTRAGPCTSLQAVRAHEHAPVWADATRYQAAAGLPQPMGPSDGLWAIPTASVAPLCVSLPSRLCLNCSWAN